MRNYVLGHVRTCGFVESFSQQPCIATVIGIDDDDSGAMAQASIDFMKQELPGSSFESDFITGPERWYVEFNRLMLFRAMHVEICAAIATARLDPAQYLLFDYANHIRDVNFLDFITDVSPRPTWSHGH